MSKTVCTYPIVGAIKKADDIIGPDRIWRGVNEIQRDFLNRFYTPEALAELARIPELESIASLEASVINAWLAQRKFDIRLDSFPEHGFGTACMLDVTVQWLVTGRVLDISLVSKSIVPGVLLKEGVDIIRTSSGVSARIQTKSGDIVHMAKRDGAPEGLNLAGYATRRMESYENPCYDYWGVHFPMVNLDQQPDISWLLDMETKGEDGYPYIIAQAKQQTKFKMNEVGARVKSAVAIGAERGCSVHHPKPPLVIDSPFLVWIERHGLSRPFFVAHITPEGMKNPGSLSNM